MRSPITRLAVAGMIGVLVVLGLMEFSETGTTSAVVWAAVAQKVEANRGFTYRQKWRIIESGKPEKVWYSVEYNGGSRLRADGSLQPEGRIFKSHYYDFQAGTYACVDHDAKTYLRLPIGEGTRELQESGWYNARDWVGQFLSHKGVRVGRKTVAGVLCEGIETTDPNWGGGHPLPTSSAIQLWISVQTLYPVLLEGHITQPTTHGEALQVEIVFDQFRWDVDLRPDFFEPNIPPDYKPMR